jgi:uncharacterized membrane protein YagU involved in acid resistance
MLQVTLFELLLRGLPEGFLFVLAAYALSRQRVNIPLYVLSSLSLAVVTYSIRLLDISFGVHTVMNIIVLVVLVVVVNKLEWIGAIKGAMIATLCLFVFEMINVFILQIVYGDALMDIVNDPYKKTLAGIPGIVLFALVICILYFFLSVRTKKNGTVENDGTSGK